MEIMSKSILIQNCRSMKKIFISIILLFYSGIIAQNKMTEKHKAQWDSMQTAYNSGFIEDALKITEKIITQTKAEANTPEYIKAVIHKINFIKQKEEEATVVAIKFVEKEAETATFPAKNLLNYLEASLYDEYYDNNRWEINQRTALDAEKQDSDIARWTTDLFFAKTKSLYMASLNNETELQKIKVDAFDAIIVKKDGRALRPTLYDFLAFEVFNYYNNTYERDLTVTEKFVLKDDAYFGDVDAFIQIKPTENYDKSAKFSAFLVLQKILAFRKQQGSVAPLVDADLIRLDFVNKNFLDKRKKDLYYKALVALEKKYISDSMSTEAGYKIAEYYESLGNSFDAHKDTTQRWLLKTALEKAQEVLNRFPDSHGAALCGKLMERIKREELSFEGEEIISSDKAFKLLAKYRNLGDLEFKFYKITHDVLKKMGKRDYDYDDKKHPLKKYYTEVSKNKPVASKSISLPQTGDYQSHSVEIPYDALHNGIYIMYVGKKGFTDKNILVHEVLQVSRLSYLENAVAGQKEIYVLDNQTGATIAGAKVEVWKQYYDYHKSKEVSTRITNKVSDVQGKILVSGFKDEYYGSYHVNIGTKTDSLFNDLPFRYNEQINMPYPETEEVVTQKQIKILTDRAIYRPGQTVYYKIIAYSSLKNKAQVIPNLASSIVLRDVNYKEVATQDFTTNAFGSANGSFTLPSSGLTGNHTLQINTTGGVYGSASINVEEYKRPKFEVKFDPVVGSYKLNEEVTVTVDAQSYAGAAIDGAQVSYKVNRTYRYPMSWYRYCYWLPTPKSTQITFGEAKTDATGKGKIIFKALPDEEAFQKDKAIFTYEIIADVIDINGETHSSTTYVNVGAVGFEITSSIADPVVLEQKTSISLSIQNLNGSPIKNTTHVEIFKLVDLQKYLKPRYWERPSQFLMSKAQHDALFNDEIYDAEDEISKFPVKASVYKNTFTNDGLISILSEAYQNWETGAYFMQVKSTSEAGEAVEEKIYFKIASKQKSSVDWSTLASIEIDKTSLVPHDKFNVSFKFEEKNLKLFYQFAGEHQKTNQWMDGKNAKALTYTATEPGSVAVAITYVWKNRTYSKSQSAYIDDVERRLNIKFETFRDKLLPGQKETWKLKIDGYKSQKVQPEFLALLYDASLDQFATNSLYLNYTNYWNRLNIADVGGITSINYEDSYSFTANDIVVDPKEYDSWKYPLERYNRYGYAVGGAYAPMKSAMRKGDMEDKKMKESSIFYDANAPLQEPAAPMEQEEVVVGFAAPKKEEKTSTTITSKETKEEPQIRKNFQETAFFYPSLSTDSTGSVSINFTIPEALTRWRMMGMAHTKDMKLGFIENQLVTQKDLMVSPNVPRFFREGDVMTIQAKVNNLTDKELSAVTKIEFFNALTMQPINTALLVDKDEAKTLKISAKQSAMAEWKVKIPEGIEAITFRIFASSDTHSDAEENTVVVLSNKMLVTETMPIAVNAGETKSFKFEKLLTSTSTTLRNHRLTFEYTSNPAWYAVQALPYLMEYPYECAEQTFSRFYANDLASYISNKHPKIKQVFDNWKKLDSKALLSNLEKNQELKNIMIEETPWLRDATDETEAKKRIALLFDVNKMSYERNAALQKLQKMQLGSGAFPWFSGMYPDRYITQHIVAGIGHLYKIKNEITDVESEIVKNAIGYLDKELVNDLEEIKRLVAQKKTTLEENHLGYSQIHYLYARTFFDLEMNSQTKEAYTYFLGQAEKYWLSNNRFSQGMVAIALFRNKKVEAAQKIVKSISQYALENEEMGMYWKENYGYYWYQAPIESQAMMIEMYAEVTNDTKAVDKLKLWLLKQKQTTRWSTTKATSEACYALLMKGTDFLSENAKPIIKLGTQELKLTESNTEAGTGYFKTAFEGKDIKKDMGQVSVTNTSKIANWGAMYWQYFENMDKITQANTSLTIDKQLFIHQRTDKGDQLLAIDQNNLKIGDLLTVRIMIKTDRNLEYVHLKDMRSAGFEPTNVLSGYRWKNGLGYYESTRDASTNFFVSYLSKGTYVFEYDLRVSHKGEFSNGITSIQCMYAPEFSSHSEGLRVMVK